MLSCNKYVRGKITFLQHTVFQGTLVTFVNHSKHCACNNGRVGQQNYHLFVSRADMWRLAVLYWPPSHFVTSIFFRHITHVWHYVAADYRNPFEPDTVKHFPVIYSNLVVVTCVWMYISRYAVKEWFII